MEDMTLIFIVPIYGAVVCEVAVLVKAVVALAPMEAFVLFVFILGMPEMVERVVEASVIVEPMGAVPAAGVPVVGAVPAAGVPVVGAVPAAGVPVVGTVLVVKGSWEALRSNFLIKLDIIGPFFFS
ncbi:MAG: hypothetical protein IJF07_03595 [Lachnospiraceae bacterium]|nr:hypothetical protein [Lachnospiraceae bacterium]